MNQLRLLLARQFAPLFWTQFFGAFNDNLFKNVLVITVTYRALTLGPLESGQLVALSAGLFILPFFLFSATAGQLSDKLPKARLLSAVKGLEIAIMGLAAVGFWLDSLPLLFAVLFFMGLQSTLFGPAKYSILPELLKEDELVAGNALVETGTFVAILLGTVAGGVLVATDIGAGWVSMLVVVVAVLGFGTSRFIRAVPSAAPTLRISKNPWTPLAQTLKVVRQNRPVYLSILGISWFWFLGAAFLTLLPIYGRDVLFGQELVVTFLLGLFCVGIAVGSLLCERMSGNILELGLVPLGSIGMTWFAFDLFLVGLPHAGQPAPEQAFGLAAFLSQPGSVRIAVDFALLAVFSGFYSVPLYTMIQERSEAATRSRVIAGNNILNALFMVASSLLLMGLLSSGATVPQIFLVLAVLNAAVALYIYTVIPEFFLRFIAYVVAHMMYRLRIVGRPHIPVKGPAILAANHVSFVDWLLMASASKRPMRFVMYHRYFQSKVFGWLFRDAKVIPIAPAHEDSDMLKRAFDAIAEGLEDGDLVCIFPEGKLTSDGQMNPFRTGIERIVARTPVPVLPVAIEGMWGSLFSKRRAARRRWWAPVQIKIGTMIPAEDVTAQRVAQAVADLGGWSVPPPASESTPVPAGVEVQPG